MEHQIKKRTFSTKQNSTLILVLLVRVFIILITHQLTEVTGLVGISSIGNETFGVKVQPIFRGEISSIHLQDKGSQYGTSDIINFIKNPRVEIVSGKDAQVEPIISNGRIVKVVVSNPEVGMYPV